MRFSPRNNHAASSGFSAPEALVGVFVATLVALAIYGFQKDTLSFNRNVSSGLIAQDEGRRALKRMSAEIRSTTPSSLGAYPIAAASASSLTIYSNIDSDAYQERLRYFLDGTTLKRGVLKPSGMPLTYNPANEIVSELIRDIANGATPVFNYYDANYDGTTQPLVSPINIPAVRLVKIMVIIDKNGALPPVPLTLTTQISLRNLKDNL